MTWQPTASRWRIARWPDATLALLGVLGFTLVWFGIFHSQDRKEMEQDLLDACAQTTNPQTCRCLGERAMSRISWLDASITGGTLGVVDLIGSKGQPTEADLEQCR